MCADEEIGKHASPRAAALSVRLESLARKEQCWTGDVGDADASGPEHPIELLNPREADRQLGIDHEIDGKTVAQCRGLKLMLRPVSPGWVICQDVQKDVGVEEDHRSIVAARERHDLFRCHASGRCTADPSKGAPATGSLPANLDEHHPAVGGKLEFDGAAGFDVQAIANALRDGDLTFARDLRAHTE